jgi:threonine dehydratase
MAHLPTPEDVLAAAARIAGVVHRTPVLTSRSIDAEVGAELFFKAEHLQRAGAFKFRGASHAVALLDDETAARGVATHSSGNHGAALALAAKLRGIPCTVVVPAGASATKREAIAAYGGRVIECAPTAEARAEGLARVVRETGAEPIHPYDDARIIAGQGTAALELLEDVPDLDRILVPVGGGGLLGGTLLAARTRAPAVPVVAVEPEGAADALASWRAGERRLDFAPQTIADGLRAPVGVRNFELLAAYVEQVVAVTDEGIRRAQRLVWTRMKQTIEPSSAVPLAALLEGKLACRGERLGIVLSGGNVDVDGSRRAGAALS